MSVGCPVTSMGSPLVQLVLLVDHDGQQGGSAGFPCLGPAFPGPRIEKGRQLLVLQRREQVVGR